MVSRTQKPTVVAGDFNDVAWSHASCLFNTKNQPCHVRVGRWLYISLGAQNILLRWDHVYVPKEFQVIDMERLPKFGSDHITILLKLYLHERVS
nr:endonuclease/exonuclease/phosphatase family protein [uncultured Pontibacter sp.]